MNQQFTNELTPEVLHSLRNPFSAQQIEEFGEAREQIMNGVYERAKIAIVSIYRLACEGAITRDGGILQVASSGLVTRQVDGAERRYAVVGDEITYPDGSKATIISGAGKCIKHNGKSLALVGSVLSNGDIIVSTPQQGRMLVEYEDNRFGDDFLKSGV